MLREETGEERRIIPFASTRARVARRPVAAGGSGGTIVFFTGVRYQRIVDEAGPERPVEADRRVGS